MKATLALVHDTSAPPLTPDNLSDQGGEPRIRDVDLAERLGFTDASMLKRLIERNAGELRTYGPVSVTVTETTAKGGRPGKVSWLNEGQCLLLCALSRTPRAAAVRKQVIDVFLAYRAGKLAEPAPATGMVMVPADLLAHIAGALDRLADGRTAGSRTLAERDAEELAVLDRFLAAHLRQLPGAQVPASALYQTYAAWCRTDDREPVSSNRLTALLRHRLQRLDGTSRPAYLDVALANTAGLPAPAHRSTGRPARAAAPERPDDGALLYGTTAIARHLGLTYRQAQHNVGAKVIPTFKVGRIRCSTVEALDAWIARELQPIEAGVPGRVGR